MSLSYIGDVNKLTDIMDNLRHCPGFKRLEAEIKSNDWEQFESAFAVAMEGYRLHLKKIPLKFNPEVTINGRRKVPDFKARLVNRWIYFEVKTSSMFPYEKELLKIEDKLHEKLKVITSDFNLKFIIKIYQEKFSEEHIIPLASFIKRKALDLEKTAGTAFPQKYLYPNDSDFIAESIFLGNIESSPAFGGKFIWVQTTIPKGRKGNSALLRALNGKKLLFIGDEEFDVWKYFQRLTEQLWGAQINPNDQYIGLFLLKIFNILSVDDYLIIGVSPPYKPENRVKRIIKDALQQLHPDNPNVVVIYSREVILQTEEIEKALRDIVFISDKYNRISCVIADVQHVTGEKERKLFMNPNAAMPLTKNEIDCLV